LDTEALTLAGSFVTACVAAGWAFFRYKSSPNSRPILSMTVQLKMIGHPNKRGNQLSELRVVVKNTGGRRGVIKSITASVRGMSKNHAFQFDGPLNQVNFPISIASKLLMFPGDWGYSYVDPGQQVTYKHTTSIPPDMSFVNVHARLESPDSKIEFITASSTFPM
jgi:hypothetical protein